jgi:hypothetical protein
MSTRISRPCKFPAGISSFLWGEWWANLAATGRVCAAGQDTPWLRHGMGPKAAVQSILIDVARRTSAHAPQSCRSPLSPRCLRCLAVAKEISVNSCFSLQARHLELSRASLAWPVLAVHL